MLNDCCSNYQRHPESRDKLWYFLEHVDIDSGEVTISAAVFRSEGTVCRKENQDFLRTV
jgi:hypothetical protein